VNFVVGQISHDDTEAFQNSDVGNLGALLQKRGEALEAGLCHVVEACVGMAGRDPGAVGELPLHQDIIFGCVCLAEGAQTSVCALVCGVFGLAQHSVPQHDLRDVAFRRLGQLQHLELQVGEALKHRAVFGCRNNGVELGNAG